MQTTLRSVT